MAECDPRCIDVRLQPLLHKGGVEENNRVIEHGPDRPLALDFCLRWKNGEVGLRGEAKINWTTVDRAAQVCATFLEPEKGKFGLLEMPVHSRFRNPPQHLDTHGVRVRDRGRYQLSSDRADVARRRAGICHWILPRQIEPVALSRVGSTDAPSRFHTE